MILGVISDTHGLVRPEALKALEGVDRILHAGDVGGPDVIAALERIAPVTAVRGNTDSSEWTRTLPLTAMEEVEGKLLYLVHDVGRLDLDPSAARLAAVIHGHSHEPRNETWGGVLYFNPGSAGPRRFRLPVCVGRMEVRRGEALRAEIVYLKV